MSPVFEHYLAGQMAHLGDLLPMVAPTVNSYKRLVEGYWAPTNPTWGVDNRTVAFRVIPGSASATRLETRLPGSDVNPYLSVAACLGAGIKGIEDELPLDIPAVSGSGYEADAPRYPRTLAEATERFARSKVARDLFGNDFVDHYAASRDWEWRRSLEAVTDWELERYFEII
jgi:glutamine synthetase